MEEILIKLLKTELQVAITMMVVMELGGFLWALYKTTLVKRADILPWPFPVIHLSRQSANVFARIKLKVFGQRRKKNNKGLLGN